MHAQRRFGEQRHVGEGTAARHIVLASLRPAHPGAVEARRVRGEVGLHADDGLDAVQPSPWRRSRRRRTHCRGRSSRARASASARSRRKGHRGGRRRRASNTRCACADGRRTRSSRQIQSQHRPPPGRSIGVQLDCAARHLGFNTRALTSTRQHACRATQSLANTSSACRRSAGSGASKRISSPVPG